VPKSSKLKRAKARALKDAEIVTVGNACERHGSFGSLVRLLLAGARRGEIAKLARNQVLSDRPPTAGVWLPVAGTVSASSGVGSLYS
jgi:hypothetical protein